MTKAFLKTIKKQLLEEKERLEKELNVLVQRGKYRTKIRFTDFGTKEDENALEVGALSDNISLKGDLEEGLQGVDKALDKIKKGKYGICEQCSEKINEKRLEIFPAATFCVACKKKT